MKLLIFSAILFCFSITTFGGVPLLDGLSDEDFKIVSEEFSTTFVHTAVTPPTSLGKVFGVEAAIIVGAHESKRLEDIAQQVDPAAEVAVIPHAMLYAGFSVPYGISIEANFLPSVDVTDLNLSHYSAGIKWSLTDSIISGLPFDLAMRTYYSSSEIGYRQTVTNIQFPGSINADISFKSKIVGGELLLGWDFPFFEPYFGVGYVSSRSTLRGTATASSAYSIFTQSSPEKSVTVDSMRLIAGFQLNMAILKAAFEYSNVYGAHRGSVKLAMGF